MKSTHDDNDRPDYVAWEQNAHSLPMPVGGLKRSPSNLSMDGDDPLPFWITIEGEIGAGKTVLLDILEKRFKAEFGEDEVIVVRENIEEMISKGIFQLSQTNPHRYAYHAQTMWFHTRTKAWDYKGGKHAKVIISERSIFSDLIFMRVQYQRGYATELEMKDYLDLHGMWTRIYPIRPSLVIYCKAGDTLEERKMLAQSRIKERARENEEKLVDKNYNEIVMKIHDKFFGSESGVCVVGEGLDKIIVPVLQFNTQENYRDDARVARKRSTEVLHVIQKEMMMTLASK